MKIKVMWTYIANFSENASTFEVAGTQSIYNTIHSAYEFFSSDFWKRATFHVFYPDLVTGEVQYEKIPASKIKRLQMIIGV